MNSNKELKRKIMFDNGQTLTLNGVVGYSSDDTTLGLHLDTGQIAIINPKRVLYHLISPDGETTK